MLEIADTAVDFANLRSSEWWQVFWLRFGNRSDTRFRGQASPTHADDDAIVRFRKSIDNGLPTV